MFWPEFLYLGKHWVCCKIVAQAADFARVTRWFYKIYGQIVEEWSYLCFRYAELAFHLTFFHFTLTFLLSIHFSTALCPFIWAVLIFTSVMIVFGGSEGESIFCKAFSLSEISPSFLPSSSSSPNLLSVAWSLPLSLFLLQKLHVSFSPSGSELTQSPWKTSTLTFTS